MEINWNKVALFAGGLAFGTAGLRVLGSKDAKKVYTQTTAAVLRAKECVMAAVTTVKENTEDILADAKLINEDRAQAEEAVILDAEDVACEENDSEA